MTKTSASGFTSFGTRFTLKSSDGQDFEIEETVAQISLSIKQTIKQDCSKTIIPILRSNNFGRVHDTNTVSNHFSLASIAHNETADVSPYWTIFGCQNGTFVIASSTVAWELLQEGDDKSTTEELEIKTEQETNDEVHCDVGVHHNNRPNTPQKAIESGYHLRLKYEGGTKTSGFMAKQNPVFQHRDSNGN
ncbi:telomere repeat-binding protein 5-like protein [Tanacetum coccineum]|uniref:Telomere repeat-binding protein 5-like protein n=1 Tax=Tanacetum coccineum TaxID=301880 RepID=A0ABQ5AY14_9ASTR